MVVFYSMPILFLIGVFLIAFEDVIKVNKAAISVSTCLILWILLITHATGIFAARPPEIADKILSAFPELAALNSTERALFWIENSMMMDLGDVSTTLFFVLSSMAIIQILDSHGSFRVITNAIKTRKKRTLVWIVSGVTFILSALLGNIATVIVIVAVLRRLIPEKSERLVFSCLSILAANAGGSWSPIGDVTTLLLWTGRNLSAEHQIISVILPAIVMIAFPSLIVAFTFKKDEQVSEITGQEQDELPESITPEFQRTLLIIGLVSLALVPVLQAALRIPPFMGVLLGLATLWVITDIDAYKSGDWKVKKLRVSKLFKHLDLSTIFFFFGILMSVKALTHMGALASLSNALRSTFDDVNYIALALGVCSSFLDNVALVAATIGMYPIQTAGEFMMDSSFWTFLAYCAVTGGSILIIGSASGVTVMGLEKIEFGYYLKKFTPLAILGYLAGAFVFLHFIA